MRAQSDMRDAKVTFEIDETCFTFEVTHTHAHAQTYIGIIA